MINLKVNLCGSSFGIIWTLVMCICFAPSSSAQFGRKLLDRTVDKLEDRAVDELSDALVSLAMRPIRKSTDAMLKQKYKERYGEDFNDDEYENDEERQAALYGALYGFYAVDLPDEYVLTYEIEYEISEDGEKDEFVMMLNPEQSLFAVRAEEKKSTAIMLFDYANDILATYDLENKEVMAFKHTMKAANAWNNSHANYEPIESSKMTITPLNKTKKIAGCQCEGVAYDSEDSEGTAYFCKDAPFGWEEMYGGMMQQVAPGEYNRYPGKDITGIPYLAESKDKKDGSESSMKVKDFSKRTTVLRNDDFKNTFVQE